MGLYFLDSTKNETFSSTLQKCHYKFDLRSTCLKLDSTKYVSICSTIDSLSLLVRLHGVYHYKLDSMKYVTKSWTLRNMSLFVRLWEICHLLDTTCLSLFARLFDVCHNKLDPRKYVTISSTLRSMSLKARLYMFVTISLTLGCMSLFSRLYEQSVLYRRYLKCRHACT